MLALDDERWKLLSHAYGGIGDVPEMIKELQKDFESEKENDLFYGCLCHQNSTYSATFAAVLHVVEVAFQSNLTSKNRADTVIFCGTVHALRNYDRRYEINSNDQKLIAKLTEEIEDAYLKAIEKTKPLTEELLDEQIEGEYKKYLFFSLLAFHEQEKLSQMFF